MEEQSNSVVIDVGQIENNCFVIMPFNSLFQIQYERVIRPALEELGLKCIRGDEIYSKPNVMSDIWKAIRNCRLVIAELTGRNPNVFYEVGLAHAIGKPIILLTRNEEDVPFDLKALRYRYYDTNDPFWGNNLRLAVQSMVQSILGQTDFSTYLEGINAKIHIPEQPQRGHLVTENKAPLPDISGNWKASWISSEKHEHRAIVYITQQDENLSATMTITADSEEGMAIIQEVLTGTIIGKNISLYGVSYTFINQGGFNVYDLDNFKLKLNADGSIMTGKYYDVDGESKTRFIKQESV